MQGLVDYNSSDEEDEKPQEYQKDANSMDIELSEGPKAVNEISSEAKPQLSNGTKSGVIEHQNRISNIGQIQARDNGTIPVIGPVGPPEPIGPTIEGVSAPQSPYTIERALLRDLTLPTVPNLDIPPSPPGSPSSASLAKFANFRKLKQQGSHFNERLGQSSALKNPMFAQKLMDFAGITTEDQYATSLPKSLWDPNGFPSWAYKDGLADIQNSVTKRKEEERSREQREAIEFVPSAGSGDSSRIGTPGIGGKGSGRSAAERIMAGLDREKSKSPLVTGGATKRGESERKTRRFENGNGPRRSRSRSPHQQRRRSRSR